MSFDTSGTSEQFSTSVGRVWSTLVEGVEFRSELFALEIKDEKQRAVRAMLAVEFAAMALFMAFLSLNTLLVIAMWESRVMVVSALLVFYTVTGLFIVWRIFAGIESAPPPFQATIGEIRKDYETWKVD